MIRRGGPQIEVGVPAAILAKIFSDSSVSHWGVLPLAAPWVMMSPMDVPGFGPHCLIPACPGVDATCLVVVVVPSLHVMSKVPCCMSMAPRW
jgi:hypothetical protein